MPLCTYRESAADRPTLTAVDVGLGLRYGKGPWAWVCLLDFAQAVGRPELRANQIENGGAKARVG